MPEPNDKDLRKLFRSAGHMRPSTDLTEMIMARVAVTTILRPVVTRPLIGKPVWIALGVALVALLVVAASGAAAAGSTPGYILRVIHLVRDMVPDLADRPMWAAGGSLCAFLFALVDRALALRTSGSRS